MTLLSVPVPGGEAFGAYQVEALAAGVPVVQPNAGCFPEFVAAMGGGVIYEPNNSGKLAETILSLLSDPVKVRELAGLARLCCFLVSPACPKINLAEQSRVNLAERYQLMQWKYY